jgi:hypothetical protein
MRFVFTFFVSLVVSNIWSQQVGINTNAPDPSAVLDVFSSDKGLLIPRLTAAQIVAIPAPAHGLMVYNTTDQCLEMYFPTGWSKVKCSCSAFPSAIFTPQSSVTSVGVAQTFFPQQGGSSTYLWSFSGGSPATSSSFSPSVTWNAADTFMVVLAVTDSAGCSSIDSLPVVVQLCGQTSGSQIFSFTGAAQTFQVPACVNSIQVDAYGAQGGSNSSNPGGLGGRVRATISVTPGEVLQINIGGTSTSNTGGWNGGGNGVGTAFGGGGATDIRRGGTALINRVVVAGGGGGGAQGNGGAGGGLTGGQGSTIGAGVWAQGGTQTQGGAGGSYNNGGCSPGQAFAPSGVFGIGGAGLSNSSCCCAGTGGGGGWYGGGGMQINGAGGGSSYVDSGIGTSVIHDQGVRNGNGALTITW